jgi:predicted transposase YbfD/YdcC
MAWRAVAPSYPRSRLLHKTSADKIADKGADYILALKGNQASLHCDIELFVKEQKSVNFAQAKISTCQTIDADHGRIETRHATLIHDVGWLQDRHGWPALKAVT